MPAGIGHRVLAGLACLALAGCGGSFNFDVNRCWPLAVCGPAPPKVPNTSTRSELLVFDLKGSTKTWRSGGGRFVVLQEGEPSVVKPRSVNTGVKGGNYALYINVGGPEGASDSEYDLIEHRVAMHTFLNPPVPPDYIEAPDYLELITSPADRIDAKGGARDIFSVPVQHLVGVREDGEFGYQIITARTGTATITMRNMDGPNGSKFESTTPVYWKVELPAAPGYEAETFLVAGAIGDPWDSTMPNSGLVGYSGFMEGNFQSAPGAADRVKGDVDLVVNFAHDTMSGQITNVRTSDRSLLDIELLPSDPVEVNEEYYMRLPLFGEARTVTPAPGEDGPEMSGDYSAIFFGPMRQYVHQSWDTPELGGSVAITNGEASLVGGFAAKE